MTAVELLVEAGWTQGRRVAVEGAIAALREAGHESWPELERMLTKYCFLDIHPPGAGNALMIDPVRALMHADSDWLEAYQELVHERLVPVGEYSHMWVLYSPSGMFYGGFDEDFGPLGESMEEVVHDIFLTHPPVPLSMKVK